jgi:hypothetical protein
METSLYNGTIIYQGRPFRIQRLGIVNGQPVAKVDPQDDDLEFALRLQLKAHGEVPLVTDPEPALQIFDSLLPFHSS